MIETFLIGGSAAIICLALFWFPKESIGLFILFLIGAYFYDLYQADKKLYKKHYEGTYYQERDFNINGKTWRALAESRYNIEMGGGVVKNSDGKKFVLASDSVRRCDFYNNTRNDPKIIDPSRSYKAGETITGATLGLDIDGVWLMPESSVERCIVYAELINKKNGIYVVK